MRILIVNRHYGDDHVPTGRMAADLVEALHGMGHEVEALSARSSYATTAGAPSASNAAKISCVWTPGEKHRLASWLFFLVQAWFRVPFTRYDRCLLLTDPPFLAALTLFLSPFSRKLPKVYWWTMDLYPEILASSGRMKTASVAYKLLRRLNGAIMRRIGGFILLGDCQLQRMRAYKTWRNEDYIVVPPWDKRPIARVDRARNRFLKKYGLQRKKVALYAGNLGEGHVFAPLIEAARLLESAGRSDWALVFVVRGSKKQPLVDAAQGISSVVVLDYQPVDWTSDLLWAADVHLITMKEDMQGLVVPSKLYGVLQTDAPVLFLGPEDADTAQEIRRYQAGEALGGQCSGADVLSALDRLHAASISMQTDRAMPDNNGPQRIADFITAR